MFTEIESRPVLAADKLVNGHSHAGKQRKLLIDGRKPLIVATGIGILADPQGVLRGYELPCCGGIMAVEVIHDPPPCQMDGGCRTCNRAKHVVRFPSVVGGGGAARA